MTTEGEPASDVSVVQGNPLAPIVVTEPLTRRVPAQRLLAGNVLGVKDVFRMHKGRYIPSIKQLCIHFANEGRVSYELATKLITEATAILQSEPTVLTVPAPCVVVGDVHGQYYDLLYILREIQPPGQGHHYLFLGDYVDRGAFSLEIILLLCALKIRYPQDVSMICGNHEDRTMNEAFTFLTEIEHKLADIPHTPDLLKSFQVLIQPNSGETPEGAALRSFYYHILELFQALPLAAVLDKRFFCVHGGIGPDVRSVDDVMAINRFTDHMPGFVPQMDRTGSFWARNGNRCVDNSSFGRMAMRMNSPIVQSLLWSDPAPLDAPPSLKFVPNRRRGAGYVFGFSGASAFLRESKLLAIIRGHEVKEAGFEFGPAHPQTRFPVHFTIFSAANYAGHYPNSGAVLIVTADNISVRQFSAQPQPFVLPGFQSAIHYVTPVIAEATCDLFGALLRVVSQEEDLAAEKAEQMQLTDQRRPAGEVAGRRSPEELNELKARLRSKLRAIAAFKQMQTTLREEHDACLRLKDLGGGKLPCGMLRQGREGVQRALMSYDAAAAADALSEMLPSARPTSEAEETEIAREVALLHGTSDSAAEDTEPDEHPCSVRLVQESAGTYGFNVE